MPRVARGLVDGFVYHVINRGNGRQQVFHKDLDYEVFVNLMKESKSQYPVQIFAYCLMPNHFHILLKPNKAEELSKWMQWLMTSHVRRYHRHYKTSGHLWQGRFKSFIVQKDSYLLTVTRYIEGNPVRAGLVKSAKDWKWSSHFEKTGKKPALLVAELPIELPKNWTEYVDTPLTEKELERVHQSVNRQSPYGALQWVVKICKELGLESTIKPRGRPRKREEK
ncbi:MAG: transposase [Elusimicrobia bacterium]|nr:transposase [Elusimicrobiota bacterium]